MKDAIIGHKRVLDFFENVVKNGRLSHAYCFVGPSGLGKRAVAERLAATLLQKERSMLSIHPDMLYVRREKSEKTGKLKKDISIDQLARCRSFLSQRPFLAEHKIVIIDEAEYMNINAANALLKTLEEPPAYAVLFLITTDETRLPQTIRSRCQTVFFQPIDEKEILDFLLQKHIDPPVAEKMAKQAAGIPGRAHRWAEHPESYEWYEREIERFQGLSGVAFYKKLQKIDELFGDKSDHIEARKHLLSVLDIWEAMIVGYGRALSTNGSDVPAGWTRTRVVEVYMSIERAKALLGKNIHPRLVVENIMLQTP
jgi:DNA polymerase-3 subunit delta'